LRSARTSPRRASGDSDPYWEILRFWVWFREAEGGLAYELNHRKVATLLGLMITVDGRS
jgi:hypothetical protein